MKRIYLLLVVMLLAISLTKAQTTPLQLNDDLASISDSLFAKGQNWGVTFNEAYKSGNYILLKPVSGNMLSFINRKTTYVQNMKDIKNSKPLRMAMLDLLAFEKKMVIEAFMPFELFTTTTPADKVQAALDSLKEKAVPENEIIKKLITEQEIYGAANGFKVGEETKP